MIAFLAGLISCVVAVGAQPDAPTGAGRPHARARLIAETTGLAPGQTGYLGVTFDIDPGWHLYWDGQNETGFPVQVKPSLPTGYSAGQLLWPAPVRHISPGPGDGILDHIYEKRVTLLLPVTVPADAKAGDSATFAADLEWLVCERACIPGQGHVSVTVPIVASPDSAKPAAEASLFAETRRRLPLALPATTASAPSPVTSSWEGSILVLQVPGAAWAAFYPGKSCVELVNPIADNESKTGRLAIRVAPGEDPNRRVTGVLEAKASGGVNSKLYSLDIPVPSASKPGGGRP
jgi:DsbC/DsbD-like thiol-disulfide interchange protein